MIDITYMYLRYLQQGQGHIFYIKLYSVKKINNKSSTSSIVKWRHNYDVLQTNTMFYSIWRDILWRFKLFYGDLTHPY